MENKSKYAAVLLEASDGKLIFHHRDNKPNIANPDNECGYEFELVNLQNKK